MLMGTALPPYGSRERPWPISVGDIDGWLYFQGPGQNPFYGNPMTSEDFIRRLNREDPPGVPAIIGQKFHSVIEKLMCDTRQNAPKYCRISSITEPDKDGQGIQFNFYDLDITLNSYSVVEQDVELVFDTPEGWVHMRGVIDGLMGTTILDLKTTKKIDADKYHDSFQWRAYLAAMGKQYTVFEYHVFQLKYGKEELKAIENREEAKISVVDYLPLKCYRYPDMMKDLQGVAAELVSYLKSISWCPPTKREMVIF